MSKVSDVLEATIFDLKITQEEFVEALIACAIQISPGSRDVEDFICDIVDELGLDIEVPNLYLESLKEDGQKMAQLILVAEEDKPDEYFFTDLEAEIYIIQQKITFRTTCFFLYFFFFQNNVRKIFLNLTCNEVVREPTTRERENI